MAIPHSPDSQKVRNRFPDLMWCDPKMTEDEPADNCDADAWAERRIRSPYLMELHPKT